MTPNYPGIRLWPTLLAGLLLINPLLRAEDAGTVDVTYTGGPLYQSTCTCLTSLAPPGTLLCTQSWSCHGMISDSLPDTQPKQIGYEWTCIGSTIPNGSSFLAGITTQSSPTVASSLSVYAQPASLCGSGNVGIDDSSAPIICVVNCTSSLLVPAQSAAPTATPSASATPTPGGM